MQPSFMVKIRKEISSCFRASAVHSIKWNETNQGANLFKILSHRVHVKYLICRFSPRGNRYLNCFVPQLLCLTPHPHNEQLWQNFLQIVPVWRNLGPGRTTVKNQN